MRFILSFLICLSSFASATVDRTPDMNAIREVMMLVGYHAAEHDSRYPASWEDVRRQVPEANESLDRYKKQRIEERYAFAPGKIVIQYAGPQRLLAYSRWLEVTGPWNKERIERRVVLAADDGGIIIPSFQDATLRQLLANSGHDANLLLGTTPIYVPDQGLRSRPSARKQLITATACAAIILAITFWLRAKRRRRQSPS